MFLRSRGATVSPGGASSEVRRGLSLRLRGGQGEIAEGRPPPQGYPLTSYGKTHLGIYPKTRSPLPTLSPDITHLFYTLTRNVS